MDDDSASILFGLSDADFETLVGPIPGEADIAASAARGLGGPPGLSAILARRDRILALAARNGIARVWIVGSVARGSETARSDLDLVVTSASGVRVDPFTFAYDLEQTLGCRVDVILDSEVPTDAREMLLAGAIDMAGHAG